MASEKDSWVRPDIAAMDAYTPIQPFDVLSQRLGRAVGEITKLDANENPYGPSPAALQAIAAERWFHIYPDPEAGALRQALSRYLDYPAELLMAGQGAVKKLAMGLRARRCLGAMVFHIWPPIGVLYLSSAVTQGGAVKVTFRAE